MKKLEIVLPLLLVFFHEKFYNTIGDGVTAARGVDFGPVVMTPLDAQLPFVPLMVFPYMIAWIYPVFLIAGLVIHPKVGVPVIRRIVAAILVLELLCYALWIAFPVSVPFRIDEAGLVAHGWLGDLVRLNYENATVWHACPSFHVAGPWLFCRAAQLYRVRFLPAFLVLFVAIALSTVAIRIHYLADIVVGLAVGELVFRLVLRRLEQRKAFETQPSRTAVAAYVALLSLASLGYLILRTG